MSIQLTVATLKRPLNRTTANLAVTTGDELFWTEINNTLHMLLYTEYHLIFNTNEVIEYHTK